jgi:hypothetical protein
MPFVLTAALAAASLAAQTPSPAPSPAPAASPTPAASAAPAAPPAPETPRPAAELQKLSFLVGDWIHAENYPAGPSGPGGKGGGRSKTAWVLGDQHLYVLYASKTPMGTVEGRGFMGWDPDARAYRLDWYDNAGRVVRYAGDFAPDGALVLKGNVNRQGRTVEETFTIKRQDDGKVLFTIAVPGEGGAPMVVLESQASPDARK